MTTITNTAPPGNIPAKEEALPLPKILVRSFYIFAVVLYVPDMLFNFFVYSDGSGLNTASFQTSDIFAYAIWFFLAMGIVGMAYFCAIMAPWHAAKGRIFKSACCWIVMLICTGVTFWNSLAYRSEKFVSFKTDDWFSSLFHIPGFSVTMILVSFMPPFLGLFFALVQPAETKRSLADEELNHEAKLARMRQQAEEANLRAELGAQKNAKRLAGWAATARAAGDQVKQLVAQQPQDTSSSVTSAPTLAAVPASVELPTATITTIDPGATGVVDFPDDPFADSDAYSQSHEIPVAVGAGASNVTSPGASIVRLAERNVRQGRGGDPYASSRVGRAPTPRSGNGTGRNGKGF